MEFKAVKIDNEAQLLNLISPVHKEIYKNHYSILLFNGSIPVRVSQSFNLLNKQYLFQNTVKLSNYLINTFNGKKQTYRNYFGNMITILFKEINDAERACEYLNSILFANQFHSIKQLEQERQKKLAQNMNNRINKIFTKVNVFEGKQCGISLHFCQSNSRTYFLKGDVFYSDKILSVSVIDKFIIIHTLKGTIEATYSSYKVYDNYIIINNGYQRIKLTF